jgi:hypothetical protein
VNRVSGSRRIARGAAGPTKTDVNKTTT